MSNLVTLLNEAARPFGMHPPEEYTGPRIADRRHLTLRRRSGHFAVDEVSCLFELRRDKNDVLRWKDGFASGNAADLAGTGDSLKRAFRRSMQSDEELVAQLQFERLKPNMISSWLGELDQKLTPGPHGLLQLDPASWEWHPVNRIKRSGRVLILIHGTFSSSQNFLGELLKTPAGESYLRKSLDQKMYSGVFAFQHPTLSVGPWLNAVELARLLDGSDAAVDILAHSRGGLVARWWADCFDRSRSRKRRCMLVGSPLAGTSLASPASIRSSMDLFTNVANVLEGTTTLASSMIPLLSVVAGLLKIIGSITDVAAKLPIADALIAAIPGLSGQSATLNNFELQLLRRSRIQRGSKYFAIRSDFQPEEAGWKFWRYFTQPGLLADAVADGVIFGQANDLVVDVSHMSSMADGPAKGSTLAKANVLNLTANPNVWHCNYFRDERVLDWIGGKLHDP